MSIVVGLSLAATMDETDPEPYIDGDNMDTMEKLTGKTYKRKLESEERETGPDPYTEAPQKLESNGISSEARPDPYPYTEENETEATQNLDSKESETVPDTYTEVTKKLESDETTEASKNIESEEIQTGPSPYNEKLKSRETEELQKPQKTKKPQKPPKSKKAKSTPHAEENGSKATQNFGSIENETGPDPYTKVP